MKKMVNIRNSVIIVLCFTIICLVVGFIIVSMELKKEKEEALSFNVIFSEIKKTSSIKGSAVEPRSSAQFEANKKSIHMEYELNAIHDEIIYEVKIKNEGTVPARIVKIMESPNYQKEEIAKTIKPITIQITDMENKIVNPKEELEVKIIVSYNPTTSENIPKSINFDLGDRKSVV